MADELNRWLRRLRPPTAADDDWTSSREADQALARIHRQTTGGRSVRGPRIRAVHWLPAAAVGTAVAVVVAVALTTTPTPSPRDRGLAGPNGSNNISVPPTVIRPAAFLLNTDPSCDALLAQLRSHTAANALTMLQTRYAGGGAYGFPGQLQDLGRIEVTPAVSSSGYSGSPNTSSTNVQEPGVDEPDVVKTDGDRLVTITDGVLRVIDTVTRVVTGSLDLTIYSGWEGAQLLVDGSHAVVTLSANSESVRFYGAGNVSSGGQSSYLFLDLDGQPKVTGSMRASGSFLDARMVGSTVRLVVRSAPVINPPPYTSGAAARDAAQRAVRSAPLSAWQPKYSVTSAAGTTSSTVPCSRISHPADFTGASMLTIYTLDMNHLGADPDPLTVAADGDTVYANATSLYIASNPQWFCCYSAASKKQTTELHRFDITGTGSPIYLGSGTVPGRLLSSYSLSDDDGYLRIATTTGMVDGSAGASNSVYVLADDTLKITGHVDGLGNNERIYAVRFMGPVAYVVTFKQTDPLYVVDLHDPANPKVTGSLTLSGVSTYLHDLGDGRLLGVGQDIKAGEGSGVQVSLFDVSSASSPKRVSNIVVPNTPSELTFDPHTFLYWQQTGLIVVPVRTWTGTQSGRVLVARVSGDKLTTVGLVANPRPTAVPDDGQGIQRSLIVNGDLWTLSGGGVQVSRQSDLNRIAWLPFQ